MSECANSDLWVYLSEFNNSGGFGKVLVYKNKLTGLRIAVKKIKGGNNDKSQMLCLKNELKILKKLDHPNIVKQIEVNCSLFDPTEHLTLEFCNGDNLAKLLWHENGYGLEEYQIKMISCDISSALKYIHSKNIYHRDMKPNNIMLNRNNGERVVYKLIDFGSAQKSKNRISQGIAGCTFQYLAPEYMLNNEICGTQAMDFWSFGTTIFECITGFRPFLPSTSFEIWMRNIIKKSDQNIYAFLDKNGELQFCSKLPSPCSICSLMQNHFEQWLRIVLSYTPENRSKLDFNNVPLCYSLLDNILNSKIIRIFNYKTMKVESFDANNVSRSTIYQLEQSLSITGQRIFLLTPHGELPPPETNLTELCSRMDYGITNTVKPRDVDLYVFNAKNNSESNCSFNSFGAIPNRAFAWCNNNSKRYKEKRQICEKISDLLKRAVNVLKQHCFGMVDKLMGTKDSFTDNDHLQFHNLEQELQETNSKLLENPKRCQTNVDELAKLKEGQAAELWELEYAEYLEHIRNLERIADHLRKIQSNVDKQLAPLNHARQQR